MKKRFFKTLKELQEECPNLNFRRNDSGGIIYDYLGGIAILHEEIVSNLGKEVVGDLLELAVDKEWLTKIEDIVEVDVPLFRTMVRGCDLLPQLKYIFPWDEQSEEDEEHDISEGVKQDKKDLAYQIMELSEDISERSAIMRVQQDALDAICPCQYKHYAFLKLSVACNEQANEEDLLLMEELRKQYSELIE